MLVMKHERMKLVTFRTEVWMKESNEVLEWRPAMSKKQRASNDSGWGRRKGVYSTGHVVLVCGSNPDYRWTSIPGWSRQLGLKV